MEMSVHSYGASGISDLLATSRKTPILSSLPITPTHPPLLINVH